MSLERRAVPTATFVTHLFSKSARGLCRMQGMEALPIIVIPHPIAARPVDELLGKVRKVYAEVRIALTGGQEPF